jgi:hypothetical protein
VITITSESAPSAGKSILVDVSSLICKFDSFDQIFKLIKFENLNQ